MDKVKIIIDSTADLSFEEIEKYNVDVIPLTINIDGNEYTYKTIKNDEYIERMRTAADFSTSQPAIGNYIESYDKWTKEGYKIIVLAVSSALSGTFSTANTAALDFDNVYVIDTKTASRGMVYLLRECVAELENGVPVEQVVENIKKKTNDILTFVTIDSLDNLVRGGRLRKSAALIGGLLNIKVLTQLKDDELVAVDKVRGKKKLVQALIKKIKEEKGSKQIKTISLPHALSEEYLVLIKQALLDEFNYTVLDENIMVTTPVVSTHTGENAVGILVELV